MTTLGTSIINGTTQMRDAVINRLFDLSHDDKDIMFFTADMGAKALDKWRAEKPCQYRDVGIAEQGMASIGAGMAQEGKKVFIYAIAPFVVNRIQEAHKLNAGVQGIPLNTIGVGTGFSYGDSGPTHYNTDDVALMRTVPNMEILCPSDSIMAARFAEHICYSKNPTYLRLERSVLPIITTKDEPLTDGFRTIEKGKDVCFISTGNMVHRALEVRKKLASEYGIGAGVVELYRLKPLNVDGLANMLGKHAQIVSLEEHLLVGGLGSLLAEIIVDKNLGKNVRLQRIGIHDKLVYLYGRDNIQKELGLDVQSVAQAVADCVKK